MIQVQKFKAKARRSQSRTFKQPPDDFIKNDEGQSCNGMKRTSQCYQNPTEECFTKEGRMISTDSNFSMITPRRFRKSQPYKMYNRSSKSSKQSTNLEFNRKKAGTFQQVQNVVRLTDLVKLFHEKLSCNSTLRQPVVFDPLESERTEQQGSFMCHIQKIVMPKLADNIITVMKILYIVIYLFAFPLSLIFEEVSSSEAMIVIKSVGIMLCLLDLLEALQTPSGFHFAGYSPSEDMQKMLSRQRRALLVQVLIILSAVVSLILTEYGTSFNSFIFGFMFINIKKYQQTSLSKLESQFFTATFYEKYWEIVKMLALNLLVCHLLACVLISITHFRLSENWMTQANIFYSPWYEKYVWSYYFGITIILTIGFGDLHAANYIEAFFIITISFFAVVFFGYNINYIGNRINSIREEEVEKNDKLKVFGTLAKKTHVPEELRSEITNYIIQESEIKKVSNYAQEKKLVQQLPSTLRSSFLQESNKLLFNHLLQLVTFSKKTIETLSQNIETKICHPEQIIKKARSAPRLMILQSGEIGYSARIKGFGKINGIVLESIANSLENQSKLICVDVLSAQPINYDIKSLTYSVIYSMDKQTFEKSLRGSQDDFENYRQILDRCKYKMNYFGLTVCKFCPNKKHTLFECPRLHFTPFRHTIPLQYYKNKPKERQDRKEYMRNKKKVHFEFLEQKQKDGGVDIAELYEVNPQIFKKRQGRIAMCNSQDFTKKKKTSSRASYVRTMEVVNQIRDELKRLKHEDRGSEFEFALWSNCDCDEAHNFASYFSCNNPSKLSQRVSRTSLLTMDKSHKKKFTRSATEIDWIHSTY